MKNILFVLISFCIVQSLSYADELSDVETFFNKYIEAANSYDNKYFDFYTSNAKIIRVVEKPDGSTQSVNVPLSRYKSEAKLSQKLMKLRRYKNFYSNIRIFPCGKDYKIVAMRMPSTSDYKIPAHFIVGKDSNGDWKIKEESMNTKVQTFLTSS